MTTWRRDPRALWRRSGTRTLVTTPQAGEPIAFDGVGSVTWELLAAPTDEEALLAALDQRFEVDPDTLRTETVAFLEHLHELGATVRT